MACKHLTVGSCWPCALGDIKQPKLTPPRPPPGYQDTEVAQLKADLAAARSEIERLKTGLRRYGLHDMECAQEDWRFAKATCPTFNEPMPDCTCGLDALLKESKP